MITQPTFHWIMRKDCALEGKTHTFAHITELGFFETYGKGIMKYRECMNCGVVEYSVFIAEDGTEIDIDAIYRTPK